MLAFGERVRKVFQENRAPKQEEVVLLISDKADYKPKLVRGDTEGHFIY
jgi:hypothetical protein